jgi:hypothetical protein
VRTKLKGERMEYNISKDAIFFNSFGNALHFRYIYKGRLVKLSGKYCIFISQRNLHEIFDTIL